MDLDIAIEKRRSIREFKGKKVSWRTAIDAIDAAIKAPFADSRCNLKFLIIESQEYIDELAKLANQTWINQASYIIIVCSDDTDLENMHDDRGRVYSRQQAGAAIENILLTITNLGLGACWIGSYSDSEIKRILKIPAKMQIEAIIPVGYEKEKHPLEKEKRKREMLENVLFWENWGNKKRGAQLD